MLEIENVNKSYLKQENVLKNISLSFDKGLVCILGQSGSGKTTLLNVLGMLDKAEGSIYVDGLDINKLKDKELDYYRNTYVGFIFQDFNLIEDFTVYENIVLPLKLQGKKIDNELIDNYLKRLGIYELRYRKPNELSGGERQRVAILRAVVKDTKIILADEVTANLDSKTGLEVMNLLKEISKDRLVILVTHNNEYASKYADRIIKIEDGYVNNDLLKHEDNTYKTVKSKLPLLYAFKLGIKTFLSKFKLYFSFTFLFVFCLLLMNATLAVISFNKYDQMFYSSKSPYLMKRVDKYNNYLPISYSNKYNVLYTNGVDNIVVMNGFKYDYIGTYPENINEVMVSKSLVGKNVLPLENIKVTGVVLDNLDNIYVLDGLVPSLKSYKVDGLIESNKYIFKLNKKIISDIDIGSDYIKDGVKVKLNNNEAIISNSIENAEEMIGKTISLYVYKELDVYYSGIDRTPDKVFNDIKIVGVGDNNIFSSDLLKDYYKYTYTIDGIYLNNKTDVYDFYDKGYISLENYDKNLELFKNIEDIKLATIVIFIVLTLVLFGLIVYFVPYIIRTNKKNIAILKSLGTSNADIDKILFAELFVFCLNIALFSYLLFKLSLYLFKLKNNFIYLSNSYYIIFITLILILILVRILLLKYEKMSIRSLLD